MTDINLQNLIDMRGAGSARKELIKAGKWNAAGPSGPDDKIFNVELTGTATAYWSKTVGVWAKDAEEAENKACQLDIDIGGINVSAYDDIEIGAAAIKEGTTP